MKVDIRFVEFVGIIFSFNFEGGSFTHTFSVNGSPTYKEYQLLNEFIDMVFNAKNTDSLTLFNRDRKTVKCSFKLLSDKATFHVVETIDGYEVKSCTFHMFDINDFDLLHRCLNDIKGLWLIRATPSSISSFSHFSFSSL